MRKIQKLSVLRTVQEFSSHSLINHLFLHMLKNVTQINTKSIQHFYNFLPFSSSCRLTYEFKTIFDQLSLLFSQKIGLTRALNRWFV